LYIIPNDQIGEIFRTHVQRSKRLSKMYFHALLALLLGVTLTLSQDTRSTRHCLDPLTGAEILLTSNTIKRAHPRVPFLFVWVTLKEPKKELLSPFFLSNNFDIPMGFIPRESWTVLVDPRTRLVYEAVVQLFEEKVGILKSWKQVPQGLDPGFAPDEVGVVEKIAMEDLTVKRRLLFYNGMLGNTSLVIPEVW